MLGSKNSANCEGWYIAPYSLLNALLHLFNLILTTGTIPQPFTGALIVVLYQKNSRLECSNCHPIGHLSHVYMLFISTIIAERVKEDLLAFFSGPQAA